MSEVVGDLRGRGTVTPEVVQGSLLRVGWVVVSGDQLGLNKDLLTDSLSTLADRLRCDESTGRSSLGGNNVNVGAEFAERQNYFARLAGRRAVRGLVDYAWSGGSPELIRDYPEMIIPPTGSQAEPQRVITDTIRVMDSPGLSRLVTSAIALTPRQSEGSVAVNYLETGIDGTGMTTMDPHQDGVKWIGSYAEDGAEYRLSRGRDGSLHEVAAFRQEASDFVLVDDDRLWHEVSHRGRRRALVLAIHGYKAQAWLREHYTPSGQLTSAA